MNTQQLLNGLGQIIGATGVILLFARIGWFGESKIALYKGDIKLGSFSRFFYDVAQFKLAGEDKITECWSITPIKFDEYQRPRNHQ